MTVLENVEVAVSYGRNSARGASEIRERGMEALRRVGLDALATAGAAVLSVGLQKRLEIARALATGPELLLCDEICGGLTYAETAAMLDLLRSVREAGTTVMYVEHDVKAITAICDRILVLNYGRKLAEGTAAEIQNNPAVIEAYLGRPITGGRSGE
jgi:branched-chain amino acid transport system ATP-binding protein